MSEEERLRQEVEQLRRKLEELSASSLSTSLAARILTRSEQDIVTTTTTTAVSAATSTTNLGLLPPERKSGYLFKWQDRSIGWGGTKWALRYVRLDGPVGQLSYYKSHEDRSPRYILTLKNCAVRDDGSKKVKGFNPSTALLRRRIKDHGSADPTLGSTTDTTEEDEDDPQRHEAGSHYYVFSVHLRTTTTHQEEEDTIVPLLRFSTQSYAEKMSWIDLISQTCEYCNSEEYNVHMQQQQPPMTVMAATPTIPQQQQQQQRGTLPALVFEAPPSLPPSYHDATGGYHKRGASFRSKSTKKDAARTNHIPYPPSKPMHRQSNPSYLSSDDTTDEKPQNFRGFFNLLLIILVVSNFRLLLDAVSKHGFILIKIASLVKDVDSWSGEDKQSLLIDLPFLSGLLIVQAFVIGAYSIERLLCQQYIGEHFGLALHFINTNSALGVVILIVWYLIEHPIVGAVLILQATITWLKLISYVHANHDHRLTMMSSSSSNENSSSNNNNIGGPNNMQQLALVKDLDPHDVNLLYPNNVTLSDIYYFWFAPTLTYQLAYPRSPYPIRWMKVLTLTGQLIICILLVVFIAAQMIAPNLDLLVRDLEASRGELRTQTVGDYLLKLSISSTYIWLLVFYGFFHCFLNLTAEILRFGDRGESFFFCEEGMFVSCLKLVHVLPSQF